MRGLQSCFRRHGRLDAGGRHCGQERVGNGLVNAAGAYAQAKTSSAVNENAARAVITGAGSFSFIMHLEAASAAAAGCEALKQRGSFSHGAAGMVRSGPGVLGDARLVALVCFPVDESIVMIRKEDGPIGARQMPRPFSDLASVIDIMLPTCFTINIGAGIDGACQHAMDGVIGRRHPADVRQAVGLQGEGEFLGAKPEPDLTGGARFRETLEDGAYHAANNTRCFVLACLSEISREETP